MKITELLKQLNVIPYLQTTGKIEKEPEVRLWNPITNLEYDVVNVIYQQDSNTIYLDIE